MTKVMAVDDDNAVLKVLQRILEKQGYEVVSFPDTRPALEAGLDGIDMVITDLDMPTRGEVLIQEIRETWSELPIVVLSGLMSKEKAEMLTAMGVDKVLEKPFMLDELLETIAQFNIDGENSR